MTQPGVAHLLVIDDDRAILEFVRMALEKEGYRVTTAANGRQALDCLQAMRPGAPDAILLDMNMPVLDGPSFCQILDADLGRKQTAVVVMTAAGASGHFSALCRADDALGKPFDLDDLYAVVERHLAA